MVKEKSKYELEVNDYFKDKAKDYDEVEKQIY